MKTKQKQIEEILRKIDNPEYYELKGKTGKAIMKEIKSLEGKYKVILINANQTRFFFDNSYFIHAFTYDYSKITNPGEIGIYLGYKIILK